MTEPRDNERQESRILPPHPIVASPQFLRMRAWLLGRGRISGYYVLPLLIGFIPLFILFTVDEFCIGRVCIPIDGTAFGTFLFHVFWNLYAAFVLFCFGCAIVRWTGRIRTQKRRHRLDVVQRVLLESEEGTAPATKIRDELRKARAKILQPKAHEPQLRDSAHAYFWVATIFALFLLVNFERAEDQFRLEGHLSGAAAIPTLLGLAFGIGAVRAFRNARRLRGGARELYEEAEAEIERHQSNLQRLQRGEDIDTLAISFRRFGAGPAPPATKS